MCCHLSCSSVRVFHCQCNIKTFNIFMLKLLWWRCWKTAAVHQRIIMLDEWDETNKLTPLELVIKRAGSTASSFAHSNFGSSLDEVASGMLKGRNKKSLRLMSDSKLELHYPIVLEVRLILERYDWFFFT